MAMLGSNRTNTVMLPDRDNIDLYIAVGISLRSHARVEIYVDGNSISTIGYRPPYLIHTQPDTRQYSYATSPVMLSYPETYSRWNVVNNIK